MSFLISTFCMVWRLLNTDQCITLSNFSSPLQFAIWLRHLQWCKPWGNIPIAAQNVASLSSWWWMTRWKMWPSFRQRVTRIKMVSVNMKTLVISAVFKEYNLIVFNWNNREQLCNIIYRFFFTLFEMSLLLDPLAVKGFSGKQTFVLHSRSWFVNHADSVVLSQKVPLFHFSKGERKCPQVCC